MLQEFPQALLTLPLRPHPEPYRKPALLIALSCPGGLCPEVKTYGSDSQNGAPGPLGRVLQRENAAAASKATKGGSCVSS